MCGIAGYIGKKRLEKSAIDKTLTLMKNRGPDHFGFTQIQEPDFQITFLHSRLAIIDLDPRSNQPFSRSGVSLIFNGEIYNYLELKGILEKRGVQFATQSDTEVLIEAYLAYGIKCVDHFEGMWSFALYDARTQQLILSRDRFAEKPLYLFKTSHGIYFGSETKYLRELSETSLQPNLEQLKRFLVNGYKSLYKTSDTFYQGVEEVEWGSILTIASNLELTSQRFWNPKLNVKPMTLVDAVEGTRERLIESMRLRLRSDVPIAFCLSGGIDSAAITSIAAKIFGLDVSTYSIVDTDERYNELENIQATQRDLGCKNTSIVLKREESLEKLKSLIRYHDAPVATLSYYIHSFLSDAISRDGCKVVFSGTAGDELYTGYYDHFNLHLNEMLEHPEYKTYLQDWQTHVAPSVRNPYLKNPKLYAMDSSSRSHIFLNNQEFSEYLKSPFTENFTEHRYTDALLRNRMLNELYHEGTRVILHEDDLNSMMVSIENRSPFLDTRLFEFAYSIPSEHLIKDGYGKFVLRQALKGILNDKVRLDRTKKGFNASIFSVFDLSSSVIREQILGESAVYDWVDRDKIQALLNKTALPNSYSKFLFNFINIKIFLELNT